MYSVSYFRKIPHFRCLTGLWISLWHRDWLDNNIIILKITIILGILIVIIAILNCIGA